jgi:hypothetical protein
MIKNEMAVDGFDVSSSSADRSSRFTRLSVWLTIVVGVVVASGFAAVIVALAHHAAPAGGGG